MDGIKLSIVIPVYNTGELLRGCFDSLYNQNLDEQKYELVCVNDGSKDNSVAIIEEYKQRHNNIVLINQEN